MKTDTAGSDESIIDPSLNVEDYAADLADFDLTDAQKLELLQTLWDIMRGLVDLGFDVGEADICGHLLRPFNAASGGLPDGRKHLSAGDITANSNDDGGDA